MKKQLVVASFCCLIIFLIFSCTTPKSNTIAQNSDQKSVLCTISMITDLTQQIAQDKVIVKTLIKKDLDPHSYELVKGDDEVLTQADLIFYNGLGLEHNPNIHQNLSQHLNSQSIGNYIQRHHPEIILKTNGELDPHIWMDISIWEKAIPCIVEHLSLLTPEHADFFQKNGEEMRRQMQAAHQTILSLMQQIPDQRRYLITCHDAFYYFARGYLAPQNELANDQWRKRFIAPEGLAPDCQLSTSDIQRVIRFIQNHNVTTIFPEYNVNLDSIYKIKDASLKSGLSVRISSEALYGDTMSHNEVTDQNYLDMILHNAKVIHAQLSEVS